jgi:uncharacterized protein (DUF4415 family)
MASKPDSKPNPFRIDEDTAPLTDAELGGLRPAAEILAEQGIAFPRKPGRPRAAEPKQLVSLRLDQDIVAHFKSSGAGWQTRINKALRKAVSDGHQDHKDKSKSKKSA